MMVSLASTTSSAAWQQAPVNYLEMYLRQVEQSVSLGNMTLAEQQISAVEQRLRTGAASTGIAGPVLRTVDQYVAQVAAQIRAGDSSSAQQALITTRQYASRVVSAAR